MASGPSDPDAIALLDGAEAFLADCESLSLVRPGWAITAAFYASLHAISAYVLVRHRERVEAHQDRTAWFRRFPELARDQFAFVSLKKQSEAARYYLVPHTQADAERLVATARQIVARWTSRARGSLPPAT